MATDCSKITLGFTMDECIQQGLPGTAARVVLMSFSDIDKGRSEITDNVISSIILKTGMRAYEVDSLPNATVGEDTINKGTYTSTHQQNLTIRIFKKSEAAKKFVNQLLNARVVAIVENNERGEDGEVKYEVYGWDSGLELNDLTATTEMTDGVSYLFTLGSGTVAQELTLPKSFFNTDEATTDAAITSLLSVAPAP